MILSGLWTCPSHAPRFQRTVLPEFLRVVRSGLEGLEHPEQAPVGVALLSQGESLVERQVGGLLP